MPSTEVVCISGTHGKHDFKIPSADILVHSGDFSRRGTQEEVTAFVDLLKAQPHRLKVVIAGNHDLTFDNKDGFYDRNWQRFHPDAKLDDGSVKGLLADPKLYDSHGIVYLENSGFQDPVTGLKFWGSPYQPEFGGWAFATKTPEAAAAMWSTIPDDTQVLLTHGPPGGICDTNFRGEHCGCYELVKAVQHVQPALHVFGHIHESYGVEQLDHGTMAVNASTCDLKYQPSQKPFMVQLDWEQDVPGKAVRAALVDE